MRVTALTPRGRITDTVRSGVSRTVARVAVDEVNDESGGGIQRDENDRPRLRDPAIKNQIGYIADMDFKKLDPGMLNLLVDAPLVLDAAGDVVGFDLNTRVPATSFALEVWSTLTGRVCADGQKWGYSLFPFLRGGYLSGFVFDKGAVSFNLRKAQTRRDGGWSVGPYEVEEGCDRLLMPVSRNEFMRTMITSVPPPVPHDGILDFIDVIDGGDAYSTSSDVVDGEFAVTSPCIVDGAFA